MTISWNHIRRVEEDQHRQDMKDDYFTEMSDEDLIEFLNDLAEDADSNGWDCDAGTLREAARRIFWKSTE